MKTIIRVGVCEYPHGKTKGTFDWGGLIPTLRSVLKHYIVYEFNYEENHKDKNS